MSIGGSLFLILLGAVFKFAITAKPKGVDLGTLGIVFMVLGALWLVLTLVLTQRRRSVITERRVVDEGPHGQVVQERRSYDDPPAAY